MAQGLQCWNANGELVLDVTDRLTRVLGEFDTGTSNGSRVDDNLLTGTPWFNFYLTDSTGGQIPCVVSFSGNTMMWTFTRSVSASVKVIYGVY